MTAGHRGRGAHGTSIRRLPVIVVVVLALALAGYADHAVHTAVPAPPSATLAASTPPIGAESTSWYCTGASGSANGIASATLYLVNTRAAAAQATMTVVNDTGSTASVPVAVPAGAEVTAVPGLVEQGTWLAARVDLEGGGVTVSELVDGSAGWAVSPCATTTSTQWYFASGSTANGSGLYVSLYNPAATAAVVDLAFSTPAGVVEPQAFEGLVVQPGQLVVAGVASYVQNQASVSTTVEARSGRVVAAELQEYTANNLSGLSLRLGSPSPESRWAFPRTVDVTGGQTDFSVFNPAAVPRRVTISVRIPTGPVAPFTETVPAESTWILQASDSTRIPANSDYATTVSVGGGDGVVVDRTVNSGTAGTPPQWGAVPGVAGSSIAAVSRRWIVPTPQLPATPPVSGATPFALGVSNPGDVSVEVTISSITPAGLRRLPSMPTLTLAPGQFAVVEQPAFAHAGISALLLEATGGIATMEDAVPAGMPGVVAMPGVPEDG